jgi:hypothetical protein
MAPNEKKILNLPLVKPLAFDEVDSVPINMNVKVDGDSKAFKSNGSFKGFAIAKLKGAIKIDGDTSDWSDIPFIKVRNRCVQQPKFKGEKMEKVAYKGDQEASFKVTWDESNLYLLIAVTDDKLVQLPRKNIAGRYNDDSVQIYIDTLGDGRMRDTRGFDGNDYEYDLFPNLKDDTLTVYRRFAPEQQIAGGLLAPKPHTVAKRAISAFKRTAKGYVYEVAFPKRILAPISLKSGTSVGFSLFINDLDDKKWKSSLTLTPPGTGGHMNPHLYPVMLLAE